MNFKMVTEEPKHGASLNMDSIILHRLEAHGAGPSPIPERVSFVPNKVRFQCFGSLQKEMTNYNGGETRRGFRWAARSMDWI